MILRDFPPMGVYETLFAFADATSKYMGDPGTHPWAQGFPLTQQLPGGPPLPDHVDLGWSDLKYPTATGNIELRQAIAAYYNDNYGADVSEENVAVFAGGRPAIVAILAFLDPKMTIAVEEIEYTPYFDMLRLLAREPLLIPSNPENRFRPGIEEHNQATSSAGPTFLVKSNPCNPTGVACLGSELAELVDTWSGEARGALFDEAYEFYADPEPDSALRYVSDLDESDIFVVGAATKGLQVPGLRVGWAVASRRHIEIFRNYSSIGMGGVSRASQRYVTNLLEPDRVRWARKAVQDFFSAQRRRYGEGLDKLGFELHTGSGGFYHWARLPDGSTADEFNRRLFEHDAGILPGRLCDMARRTGKHCPVDDFIRFSFGPLAPDSFANDMEILARCCRPS